MRWLSLLVVGLAAFVPINEARACSCMKQSLQDGMTQSQAIFEGTVTKIAPNLATEFRGLEVTLIAKRAWKGVTSEEVRVITASNGAVCGYPFAEGSTYLVYAYRNGREPLRVSLCSLTKPIDQAKADLGHLGKATTAFGGASKKGRCSVSHAATQRPALPMLALLVAGLALITRRSRHSAQRGESPRRNRGLPRGSRAMRSSRRS